MATLDRQVSIFPLLLSNFIGTMGFSIVLPFLVFLVLDFGGNSLVYGILAAIYPAFQLIGAPILGKWSDKIGRKKILLISNVGTFIGWMIFLVALLVPTLHIYSVNSIILGTFIITLPMAILFLARALDGITGGNISVANAYLADVSTDKNRSKNFGKMAISSNLGFIVGPALAGLLGATVYKELLPVLAAVFISLIALIVIAFKLKESKVASSISTSINNTEETESIRKAFSCEPKECYKLPNPNNLSILDVFRLKNISFLLVLYFFIFLGFNVFYTAFPIHAATGLKWSTTEMGIFYSVLSAVMILVQGPILRKALQKFSEEKLVIIGSLILSINFVLFILNSTIFVYVALILFAVGNGLSWPSFMSILSKRAGTVHQGVIQGVGSSMGSLASIIGLVLGGILYNMIGPTTFLVSAVVIFLVFIMSFRLLTSME
ncbi:MFS transporter [Candidatus Nitrosocosmicus agrestis]|uniref:MFS transporter n=1 Tax=Candidatus Nitrosocosmicus agrestis TaxID=2563600 RepID=UPI0019172448|nr:MFS transporter [Candidatus Nitrosocosmicus sp. SS]MDR4489574.1 MFS transporter [Candidatus Nitrosocosmicus sp.]